MLNDDINSFTGGMPLLKQEYQEAKTPKHPEHSMSPMNQLSKQSMDFSQSLNAKQLQKSLMDSMPAGDYDNHDHSGINESPDFKASDIQLKNPANHSLPKQHQTPSTKPHSSHQLKHQTADPSMKKSSQEYHQQQDNGVKERTGSFKTDDQDEQEEYDKFVDDDQTLLKKSTQAGHNPNYQTASFGGVLQSSQSLQQQQSQSQQKPDQSRKGSMKDQMYTSMSDIGFSSKNLLIPQELRDRMIDAANHNWKVRTDTIDSIANLIQEKISTDPHMVMAQSETLIEFLTQLLGDQNFKIVLSTLMILNKVLLVHIQAASSSTSATQQSLGRYVLQLIKKLGDSKNIIRSETIRALIGIYEIMKNGDKQQNNFVALILPYMNNSSNWHIREELLNVLIICFLKSRNFYDFDAFQVIESILKLLSDQKERIKMNALEALVTYQSIGNKFSVKEIIYQLVDKETYEVIAERMEKEMVPFINQQGSLEFPYLDQLESMGANVNASAIMLPNLSRRESMSSNTTTGGGQAKVQNQSASIQRGNSSGRRIVQVSANSQGAYQQQQISKRTVSASNYQQQQDDTERFIDSSPMATASNRHYAVNDYKLFDTQNQMASFLPQLNKTNSQYYNSYYSSNNSMVQAAATTGQQIYSKNPNGGINQLRVNSKQYSDSYIYQQARQQQQPYAYNPQILQQAQVPPPPPPQMKEMTFGGLHKNAHSANTYNNRLEKQISEPIGQQSPLINKQSYLKQTSYEQYEEQIQRQSAQRSRVTATYDGESLQQHQDALPSQSQQKSRATKRDDQTPQRKNIGNTFYSDGSFTTTSTSIPDKIKALKNNKRIIQMHNELNKRNINSVAPGQQQQDVQQQSESYNSSQQKSSSAMISSNQRGPIKATRQALGNAAAGPEGSSTSDLQNLCIDNRKMKLKGRNPNNDLSEVMDDNPSTANQSLSKQPSMVQGGDGVSEISSIAGASFSSTKVRLNQMRRTNFSQGEQDDAQKYVPSDELTALDNPEKEMKRCFNLMLGSEDWSVQFEACNIVRKLCKHHSSLILQQGAAQLSSIVGQLIKIADSLRSSLSKIALMTINDMFAFLKRCMEPYLDIILKILLKKGSDTNTFISDEAEKALISLCNHCQDTKVLQTILLSNTNAKSNPIRQKLCKCLETLVKSLGNNVLFFKDNDKLINQLAFYLCDACPEVRSTAKSGFLELSKSIMGQNDLEKLLQRVLNETLYKKVKDFLDKEPLHLVHNQSNQSDFLITNANAHYQQTKKQPTKQPSKGQLRTASLNKSSTINSGEQQLNIQATKILKPSQIKKRDSQTVIPQKAFSDMLDQFFIDSMKDIILKTQTQDWKQRLDSVVTVFDFIEDNHKVFSSKSVAKLVDFADTIARLINDSNAKIQQLALEKFHDTLPNISQFIEQFIITFYQALALNLASSNVAVKKQTEQIMASINERIDKSILVQPLVSLIQFSSNARLKPLLIDQLIGTFEFQRNHSIELIEGLQDQKHSSLSKVILPLSYKLLEDNRNDVKLKSEKLLKSLHQAIGQQVIDQCPQAKLQRVCDIVMGQSAPLGGGATFGASAISGVLLNVKGHQ